MRRVVVTLLVGWVQASALAEPPVAKISPMPEQAPWCLQAPAVAAVPFHGLDESEASRLGPNYMMYPMASAGLAGAFASLAAGIATHGALVKSMESKQARERAERADQVLAPYRPALDRLTTERLYTALTALHPTWLKCGGSPEPDTWVVEIGPALYLTQDQSNVIAQVSFRTWPATLAIPPHPRQTAVRVVSSALEATEFKDRWTTGDGALLAEKSAALVAEAIEIAMRWEAHETVSTTVPFATYRLVLGKHEHTERAQRMAGDCRRAVLRTLRGDYLSASIEDSNCEADSATATPPSPSDGPASAGP